MIFMNSTKIQEEARKEELKHRQKKQIIKKQEKIDR